MRRFYQLYRSGDGNPPTTLRSNTKNNESYKKAVKKNLRSFLPFTNEARRIKHIVTEQTTKLANS